MAPRTIKAIETETVSAPKENNELGSDKSELATRLPISVGNPMAADLLAIDQSHMEEFASAEEKSSDVRIGKPPKGHYFTVRAEPVKPWKDRAFYFLLEIEGRDPYIVAPAIAKLKADEDVIRPVLIVRYVTMAGEEGLWALKLDQPDAKSNPCNKSALGVLEEAEKGLGTPDIGKRSLPLSGIAEERSSRRRRNSQAARSRSCSISGSKTGSSPVSTMKSGTLWIRGATSERRSRDRLQSRRFRR